MERTLGLYLHIPFCRQKCLYCDFCSVAAADRETMARYAERLCRDLVRHAPDCREHVVDSIFFGGGTPTLLPVALTESVMQVLFASYRVDPEAEITVECNPATADRASLSRLRAAGFNRLSIGLQSSHESELRALGRIHGYADFCKTFGDARAAGFANISVDLMSGIPGQTAESWIETIDRVSALAPEHLSAYGLILEEGTPFYEMRDSLPIPDEETARRMYFDGIDRLAAHGYLQYEISNFARPGYASRHNLKYWNCDEHLGFGPAAYSDFGGARFGNSSDLAAYLGGEGIECERESLSKAERMQEYIMLRLRLTEGVCERDFADRFGCSFIGEYGAHLEKYARMGLIRIDDDRVAFTKEGLYVSNAVLSEILDFTS